VASLGAANAGNTMSQKTKQQLEKFGKTLEPIFARGAQALLAIDAAGVAVFLATVDSVSSPCGLGSEYWGTNLLQRTDAVCNIFRGVLLLLSLYCVALYPGAAPPDWKVALPVVYFLTSVTVSILSVISSLLPNGLECPNADNLIGCDTAEYWMVPRNYCAAQLKAQQRGCVVPEQDATFTQMCVRLGRAPLVNGAFGAWLLRTLVVDILRMLVVAWALNAGSGRKSPVQVELRSGIGSESSARNALPEVSGSSSQGGGQSGASDSAVAGAGGGGNDELRPPSTLLHERDTLLQVSPGDGVIRQSPHVRKRANSSALRIDF
tara:strand:- start:180 stop:1142 length:963 start_codon:yes stop_codon:yes gene_type:complete